ncbi:hypothetical protein NXW89_03630 [Bacteroides thetaiotaomicron]|nr:hypothetical protein [Bacteroides thetaiotaomicron]
MKEQIISERANIIANLRQLVQSLVELNMRAKTHVSSNKADIKKLRKDNKELEKMKNPKLILYPDFFLCSLSLDKMMPQWWNW